MSTPNNAAANTIQNAQSVIRDLTTQLAEITVAIARQEEIIEGLLPYAEWETLPPVEPESTTEGEAP